MMKKMLALLAAAVMLLSMPFGALAEAQQVENSGGSLSNQDGVTISKFLSTIAGDEGSLENFFDVTLKVEIHEEELRKQAQFSTEIVMVLDVSNTMTAKVEGSTTRMDLVKAGMKSFVSNIAQKHPGKVDLSLVVFNTDANTLIDGYTVQADDKNDSSDLQKLIDSITPSEDGVGGGGKYDDSYKRFTNIEGGLQLAYNLLRSDPAEQQYVILMTDGFPTTYNMMPGDQDDEQIVGYNPYTSVSREVRKFSGNYALDSENTPEDSRTFAPSSYNDSYYGWRGYFADAPFRQLTPYGTSYSDWGAYYAQRLAMHMKGYYKDKYANLNTSASSTAEYVIGKPDPNNTNRINIFTMGVSLGAQTIDKYQESNTNVVDAMKSSDLSSKTYPPLEKPNLSTASNHIIGEGSTGNAANNDKNYENWLGYVIGGGQGFTQANNGQQKKAYYSLNKSTDVSDVYSSILQTIEEINYHHIIDTMFTSDPMGEQIDVVGLYSRTGELAGMTLNGQAVPGGEDDAAITYEDGAAKLSWSLGKSGYSEVTENEKTTRTYELKYRVRLKNELGGFVEAGTTNGTEYIYPTNGNAILSYRVDDTGEVSDTHTINFPLPSVKGYLGEFAFLKLESGTSDPIPNVQFTLRHNWNCPVCIDGMDQNSSGIAAQSGEISQHGEHVTVSVAEFTAYSDTNGKVVFENIPSGHSYTLYETMPDGYGQATEAHQWPVVVDFDKVTFDGKTYDSNDQPKLYNDPQIKMTHLQFKGSKSLTNTNGFDKDLFGFACTLETVAGDEHSGVSFESTAGTKPNPEAPVLSATVYAKASEDSRGETGEVIFPLIHVFGEGQYKLTIAENAGSDSRVDYTNTKYEILFTVGTKGYTAENAAILHVTNYKVYANGSTVPILSVSQPDNSTHAKIDALLQFENVHKVTEFALTKLDEDTNRPIEGVEFTLEHACAACSYTINPRKTLSDDLGAVSFTYVPVGHDYRLTETKPVGYDGLAHSIGVKIADDGSITYTDENGKLAITGHQTVLFNSPKYYKDAIAFGGLKYYNNTTNFEEGRFAFELYELKPGVSDWQTAEETDWKLIDTVLNGAGSTMAHEFRFDDVTITDVGVYVYRIREQEGKVSDIAYDPAVYTVVATVEQGELYHDHDHFNFKITYQLYKDGTPVALDTNDSMIRVAMHTEFSNYLIPPITGDDMQLALVIGVMLLSGMGAVLMIRRRRNAR